MCTDGAMAMPGAQAGAVAKINVKSKYILVVVIEYFTHAFWQWKIYLLA